MSDIIQIRKKGGIQSIKTKHGFLKPLIFEQDAKDHSKDGEVVGEYKGGQLPTGKYYLSPTWLKAKSKWAWGAPLQDLKTNIKALGLRYEDGHELAGKLINVKDETEEDLNNRLRNRNDEVFNHSSLYGRDYITGGASVLNLSDPFVKFLYHCMMGDDVNVDRRGVDKSKYLKAGSKLELVSIKEKNKADVKNADKEIEAMSLLGAMRTDEDRMRAISDIMDLPNVNSATDINGLVIILKDLACQNTTTRGSYGGKTYQQRFLDVASLPDEELAINRRVMLAVKKGYVRLYRDYASFKGVELAGVNNHVKLINYFSDPENNDKYIQLIDLFENKD